MTPLNSKNKAKTTQRRDTQLSHLGLSPDAHHGIPNPPIYRTSTILSSSLAQHRGEVPKTYDYGRIGTPTSESFEQSIAHLYGADRVITTPSGLSAVTTAILTAVQSGDHALFPDNLYGASRRFVSHVLSNMGVTCEFYPPRIHERIADLCRDNTKLIYIESPGSLTFELLDMRAVTQIAKSRNITTIMDNTWGTALHCQPFDLGIDIIVEAATKYICGHADISLGVAAAKGGYAQRLKRMAVALGICASPDDLYTALRSLRTMRLRLEQSAKSGLYIAERLSRPAPHPSQDHGHALEVLHPALETSPDHALFMRDFTGCCGLFGFILPASIPQSAIDQAVEAMQIFKIGDSWGGFESLITQAHLTEKLRQFAPTHGNGHLIRLYVGLEDAEDLMLDVNNMLITLGLDSR